MSTPVYTIYVRVCVCVYYISLQILEYHQYMLIYKFHFKRLVLDYPCLGCSFSSTCTWVWVYMYVCHMYMYVCMYVLACMYFNNNNNDKMNCVSSSSDIFIKSKIDAFVAAGSEVHSKNSHTEMHRVFCFVVN